MADTIQSCFRRYEKKYLLNYRQYEAICAGMAPYMEAAQAAFYLDIKGDSDVIFAERVL